MIAMVKRAALVATCLAAAAKSVNVTVYPLMNEPTAPALLGCDAQLQIDNNPLAASPALWLKSWWNVLSSTVRTEYNRLSVVGLPDPRSDALLDGDTVFPNCEALLMVRHGHISFSDAYCQCNEIRTTPRACSSVAEMNIATQCITQAVFDTAQCDSLKSELTENTSFPTACTGGFGSGTYVDMPMDDGLLGGLRNIPATLDVVHGTGLYAEGSTYYLAWMAVQRFMKLSLAHKHCSYSGADAILLPGWETVLAINSAEEGEMGLTPAVALLRRGNENFVLLVRDSTTTFEGRLTAEFDMALQHAHNYVGPVQQAYSPQLAMFTGPLDFYFHNFFKQNYKIDKNLQVDTTLVHPRVAVVGSGSYGSGLAAVLAHYLANRWDTLGSQNPWALLLSIDAILFGAPRVGSQAFAESYRHKVNSRNIVSKYYAESLQPCGLQRQCNKGPVDTGATGNFTSYSDLGGKVVIDTDTDLAFDNTSWQNPGSRLDFVGHSLCATKCWLTYYFCPADEVNMCSPDTCPGLFDGI